MGALVPVLVAALVLVVLALCLVPFLDKAFSIDDPLFLWLGQHIQESPGDPFGFYVNWSERPFPMHGVTKNPPGMGYTLAAVGALVGWSERALHAAGMIPAAMATLATFGIARRLRADPLLSTALAVLSPVFLVSSTMVMADVTLLAFWCGAVWCFLVALDTRRSAWLLGAGVLVLFAALTKYFGIALVPLLALYLWLREPGWTVAWLVLLIPLVALGAHELWLYSLYERSVLLEAFVFAGSDARPSAGPIHWLVGLAFAGGCLPAGLVLGPWLWSRRAWLISGGLLALGLVHHLVLEGRVYRIDFLGPEFWPTSLAVQFLALVTAGVAVAGMGFSALRQREPDDVLLALWLLGTLGFAVFLNWTPTARTFLPIGPALGILIARRLSVRRVELTVGPSLALGVCAALAIGIAVADARWAGRVRDAAREMGERFVQGEHQTLAMGHWGLQWYLEAEGVRSINYRRDRITPGDVLISPSNGYGIRTVPSDVFELLDVIEHPGGGILHTMAPEIGSGFHAGGGSPLPWAFGAPQPDRYAVWRAREPYTFPRRSGAPPPRR